jgi:hypothetical protein
VKESKIQSAIIDALCLHKDVAWCMVVTSGGFKVRGSYIQIGQFYDSERNKQTGVSDIIGQLKDGRFFCIEVKRPKEKPTKEQLHFLKMVRESGGVSGWADNVKDALNILKA